MTNARRQLLPLAYLLLFFNYFSAAQLTPAEVFSRARGSVVLILAADESGKDTVQGSGFIISPNRIVTNHHVLAGTSQAYAIFYDGTSTSISGVVADSPARDLVVVAAGTSSRAALPLGDELLLREGDPVLALGSPEGLQFSITDGIVSGFRDLDEKFLIQTTAPIAHGSSGGPLLNREGKVIGITSSMLSNTAGIYFSIGVGDLKRLMRTPNLVAIPFGQWAAENNANNTTKNAEDIKRVRSLIDEKKYADARQELERLLSRSPNDATFHSLMGRVADALGDSKTAVKEFAKATSLNPQDASVHAQYAIALFEIKSFEDALKEVQTAKRIDAATSDGLLAIILYANGKYTEAAPAARDGLAKDPKDELSLEVMAGIDYNDNSNGDSWRQDAARLADVDKNAAWVLIAHGLDELKANRRDNALAAFQAAKKDQFPDPLPYVLLATLYSYNGDPTQAEVEISAGLAELPSDTRLLAQGVGIALKNRDRRKADERFSALQARARGSREELATSCLYYYGTNEAQLAVSSCAQALQSTPDNAVAHSNYGWAALDANQLERAANEFARATQLEKGNKLAALREVDLGWGVIIARYYSGDRKGANEILQLLKKDYPNATSIDSLQRLPLVWSDTSLTRIQQILRDLDK